MIWTRRLLIALPFVVAGVLMVLMSVADRLHLHRERIAGYGFLFATPWAWLLDHDWFGSVHPRWLEAVITYAIILWLPALLYSGCLWLLIRALRFGANRLSR
jgi:hypothetical protein